MLEKLLSGIGSIDAETRMLLARLAIRAGKSGDANRYLKERVKWILAAEDSNAPPPEWTLSGGGG